MKGSAEEKALMSLQSCSDAERFFSGTLYLNHKSPHRVDQSHKKMFVILWGWWVLRGWMGSWEGRAVYSFCGWQVRVLRGGAEEERCARRVMVACRCESHCQGSGGLGL